MELNQWLLYYKFEEGIEKTLDIEIKSFIINEGILYKDFKDDLYFADGFNGKLIEKDVSSYNKLGNLIFLGTKKGLFYVYNTVTNNIQELANETNMTITNILICNRKVFIYNDMNLLGIMDIDSNQFSTNPDFNSKLDIYSGEKYSFEFPSEFTTKIDGGSFHRYFYAINKSANEIRITAGDDSAWIDIEKEMQNKTPLTTDQGIKGHYETGYVNDFEEPKTYFFTFAVGGHFVSIEGFETEKDIIEETGKAIANSMFFYESELKKLN